MYASCPRRLGHAELENQGGTIMPTRGNVNNFTGEVAERTAIISRARRLVRPGVYNKVTIFCALFLYNFENLPMQYQF